MKKNTKILIVVFAAILLAAAAAFLIVQILSPARTTVYLFNDSYPAGTVVKSNMFTPTQVDSKAIILGAKSDLNAYFVTSSEYTNIIKSGDTLKIDVNKGMPLMKSMLSIAGGSAIEMRMDPSSIAVTVSVNSVKGVTSELKPGAHVNVYFTSALETKLLFESMRVLNVEKNTNGSITAVSLEANHQQAVVLVNAAESGSIYLGLVNSNGYQYILNGDTRSVPSATADPTLENPSGLTIEDIMNGENPEDNSDN